MIYLKPMKLSSSTYLFTFTGLIGLSIVGFSIWGTGSENETVIEEPAAVDYTEFAECVADSGAVFYHASWCGHCEQQKLLFGDAWTHLNEVQCDVEGEAGQIEECVNAGIEAYPTWIFSDGTKEPGVHPLISLAETTGCVFPE